LSYYQDLATQAAGQYGVPEPLFNDVIAAESSFNPIAYNSASGAAGIAQFIPSTASNVPGYGAVDPYNAPSALSAAAAYLSTLFQRTGSWTGALNAYSGNSSGGAPYPGNSAIAGDLAGLGGSTAGSSTTAGTGSTAAPGATQGAPGATSCGLSPSCWLGALGSLASRFALVLLAVLLILGGLWLFASRTAIQQIMPAR